MKSKEIEGPFELYVTRTPGYIWALFFRALHVHPIAVTLLSIVIGASSGYFFWMDDLRMNLIGMFLLIWANWYDCADGQLARMTGQKTLVGRLLDGLAGDIWFVCINLGLAIRMTTGWESIWVWILLAWAGLRCHARQCAIADYYRNIHLYFQLGKSKSELDSKTKQHARMAELRWDKEGWFEKLYLFFYSAYTKGQEDQAPAFQRLKQLIDCEYDGTLPEPQRQYFLAGSRPLMKWCNIMTFDARVGVLFASLFAGLPWLYPVMESTIFEYIRFRTKRIHERLCMDVLIQLSKPQN